MRYMYLVIPAAETAGPPPQRLMDEMAKLIEKRTADGSMIDTGGLLPTAMGAARVTLKQGKLSVTDGPFAETREQLGGYYIVEAKDQEEAIEIAGGIPGARMGTVEVRPILEIGGLPEHEE